MAEDSRADSVPRRADNQDDGTYSCANAERLTRDLKGKMGFKGFVQSDWGAGHGTTVAQGLDMDMPMRATPDYTHQALAQVAPAAIDHAVGRTLTAMYPPTPTPHTHHTPPHTHTHTHTTTTTHTQCCAVRPPFRCAFG